MSGLKIEHKDPPKRSTRLSDLRKGDLFRRLERHDVCMLLSYDNSCRFVTAVSLTDGSTCTMDRRTKVIEMEGTLEVRDKY